MWAFTLIALFVVSAISLVGALALVVTAERLERGLIVLISFAAGALLGDAFLHLLPEIANSGSGIDSTTAFVLLAGLIAFFVVEKILHWHHAHLPHKEIIHPVATINLIGDGVHNFLDGAIVAAAFAISTRLGVATAVAVALHEIPQELGDFGILVHAGMRPRRALVLNFSSGLAAVVGGVTTLSLASLGGIERVFLPFSAGAFIYIASTDLIPELHKEPDLRRSAVQLAALLVGIGVMASLLLVD